MKDKTPKKTFSIRLTVIGTFFIVSTLTAGFALGLQYYFSKDLAKQAVQKEFEKSSEIWKQRISGFDKQAGQLLEILGMFKSLEQKPMADTAHPELTLLSHLMMNNENIYALYAGYENGDFIEFINLDSGEHVRERFGAGAQDRWAVIIITKKNGKRTKYIEFFDTNLKKSNNVTKPTDYDPRERPWYKAAVKSEKTIRTNQYVFALLKQPGITYAKAKGAGKPVFGVDISVEGLSRFVQRQNMVPDSEVYLFKADGRITGHAKERKRTINTEEKRIKNPVILDFTKKIDKNNMSMVFDLDGKKNLGYVVKYMSPYSTPTFIWFFVPIESILKPYMEKIRYALLFTFLLLLLLSPLVWYFATLIVNPIKALALESDKVKNRKYDEVAEVKSNITEIINLSRSMVSMAKAIKAYEEAQREMMDSFIKLIAQAIDQKSPYTGGHCARVPVVAEMLARAATEAKEGSLADFAFTTKDEWREFRVAAWLHDCGKVTTPEYIVDKGSKLEVIYNRIHEVRMRFEVLLRDAEIEFWQAIAKGDANKEELRKILEEKHQKLKDDFSFVAKCNVGGEFMAPERVERLKSIAQTTWTKNLDDKLGLSPTEELRTKDAVCTQTPCTEFLLADRPEHIFPRPLGQGLNDGLSKGSRKFDMDVPEHLYNQGEIYNLSISKGTLTAEDRYKIQEHVVMSIKMLEMIPYPENLVEVPEIAGAHHETLIGTGYPRKLKAHEMSIPARIMALSDIYEALTASDRPYKKAKTLSETIRILGFFVKDQHIDKELFELFLTSGVYKEYAKKYLKPEQIDEVDLNTYLNIPV
ncbi:MAG: amino acid ABC transporter [Desulfobacteraceae bacterium]|nr:amino acid ABC transporter [Desulfobacteraceae bacterium]